MMVTDKTELFMLKETQILIAKCPVHVSIKAQKFDHLVKSCRDFR